MSRDNSTLVTLYKVGEVHAFSLSWHEWCSYKGKKRKIYSCGLALSSEPQKLKFHVIVCQKIEPKSVPQVQHDYFSSLIQSNHWFVMSTLPLMLQLPSSFVKLPISEKTARVVRSLQYTWVHAPLCTWHEVPPKWPVWQSLVPKHWFFI